MKNKIITSSRKVGMWDINALLSAPISRMSSGPQGRDDEGRRGFTLMEVLIVVLIIAILAAVAVPQYQKAVIKSRYSALMPIAKSLATGNEAYYMEKGQYATSPTELDVAGQTSYPDGATINIVNDTSKDMSYVIVSHPQLMPNNKHIVFQKHSGKFADVTLCEATADAQATWLCKDALHGRAVTGNSLSGSGWTAYVLSGDAAGSSFASVLEQQAATLLAKNPNYAVGSIDEENGTITMCDTSNSTIGANGECVATEEGIDCSTYGSFAATVCYPYEITYDAAGNIVGETSCSYYYRGKCVESVYQEKDSQGQMSYLLRNNLRDGNPMAAVRPIYEAGVLKGYRLVNNDVGGTIYTFDENWEFVDGSYGVCNGQMDWENATCL